MVGGTLRRGTGGHYTPNTHTLTKTNPYRHKVLTNGSFLNLKDSQQSPHGTMHGTSASHSSSSAAQTPVGGNSGSGGGTSTGIASDDAGSNSSRPTTSTEDNHSETSSGGGSNNDQQISHHQQGKMASVVNLKRSNTSSLAHGEASP